MSIDLRLPAFARQPGPQPCFRRHAGPLALRIGKIRCWYAPERLAFDAFSAGKTAGKRYREHGSK
jgi:hypothetical protein